MALTQKLGAVSDCGYDSEGMPDPAGLKASKKHLFDIIKSSDIFPKKGWLLDIGSGSEGTEIVNMFGREFPGLRITYLDSARVLLKSMNKNNRVCADACKMPFQNERFDMACGVGIIADGVLKNCQFFKNESYLLAKEAHRTLKTGSWFIFSYCGPNDLQTVQNLSEIGFKELRHVQRIFWYGLPSDVYAAKK